MYSKTLLAAFVSITISCKNSNSQLRDYSSASNKRDTAANINPYTTISDIPAPNGFRRITDKENSFSGWLKNIRLKKSKTVHLFDGTEKRNQSAQFAVLDIPVGKKDLQQCADAVMRLRASYLFDNEQYNSIIFFDNDGKEYKFTVPYNEVNLNNYLQRVFAMCGTASLSRQLKKVDYEEIQAGDVFIRGGFPGHAVIVTDIVVNKEGQKKYMLAQSYMPAQEIHILLNPQETTSPWYDLADDEEIETPEYRFYSFELKRW